MSFPWGIVAFLCTSSAVRAVALVLWFGCLGAAQADEFDDHYNKAGALHKERRFEEAITELESAFRLKQLSRLLLSIANLHRKLGHSTEALDYYERFLQAEPNPEPQVKAEVEANMQAARALLKAAGKAAPTQATPKAPEPRASTPAQEEPPPALRVRVLKPHDGIRVSTATVPIEVARLGQGTLRFAVNGKEVRTVPTRGANLLQPQDLQAEPGAEMERVLLPIPEEDSQVTVWAEGEGQRSETAVLHLRWAGQREFLPYERPALYIVAIGVGANSSGKFMKLSFPAKDARDLVEAFRAQEGRLYRKVEHRVVVEELATRENVLKELDWLRQSATQHDVAVLFMAGHGINEDKGGYHFVTYDGKRDDPERTMIAGKEIQDRLRSITGKVLVFMDTCHAGASVRRGEPEGDVVPVVRELLKAGSGRVVFTAAGADAASLEKPEWNNGAFTKAVVEGLNGRADLLHNGRITVNTLDVYVSERVKELTGGEQATSTDKHSESGAIEDFPLSVAGPAPPRQEPGCRLCRKWWFWTSLGVGLAAVGVGLAVGLTQGSETSGPPATDLGNFSLGLRGPQLNSGIGRR